ncbi:MAG: hypothetical protein ACT4QD_09625 [Acidobacteriota bacterium]
MTAGDVTGVMIAGGTMNPYNYNGVGYDGRPSEPAATTWIYDVTGDTWIAGPSFATPTRIIVGSYTAAGRGGRSGDSAAARRSRDR